MKTRYYDNNYKDENDVLKFDLCSERVDSCGNINQSTNNESCKNSYAWTLSFDFIWLSCAHCIIFTDSSSPLDFSSEGTFGFEKSIM